MLKGKAVLRQEEVCCEYHRMESEQEENKAKALRFSRWGGPGRTLHRWGGVTDHIVVVGRRAVTLQAGVQDRILQAEVQRGDGRGELLPLCLGQH